ncbi:MAG TPA: MFS transporter [Acidimicrobiales bacterium]|nr:MFS transporter [Acidimicrobiales bacterium]
MARGKILVDVTPFRKYPQFFLLWSGFLVRTVGNQLTVVAVPYQVYRLTHSSLDVGLVSLVQLGPLLVGSLFGGTIADAFDRRRVLVATQVLLAATSVGLALNSGAGASVWPLFVCSAAAAGFQGVDNPASTAFIVNLVDRETIVGANALWQVLFQAGQVAGPGVAGVLLARFSIGVVYWIDVASYAASLVTVLFLRKSERPATGVQRELGFGAMVSGVRYLRGHQPLQGIFLADLSAMVFGMPRALFPAMGLVRFHGSAVTVGLLFAAPGVGSLVGSLLTGWVHNIRRQGRAVILAVVGWGVAITLFGLSPWLWPGLVFLGIGGAFDVFSAVFRGAILQLVTPRGIIGRMQAVQIAVVTGGPRLGDLEHGALGAAVGSELAVVSGGIACIVGVLLLVRYLPHFDRLTIDKGVVDFGGRGERPADAGPAAARERAAEASG